ncbi:MAG: hypothetical protein MUF73_02090 [Rhodobacteraceae bacterium]|jgi:hypothetical protein|nr:hypothetical protein [Paracoccaceae bacterium]
MTRRIARRHLLRAFGGVIVLTGAGGVASSYACGLRHPAQQEATLRLAVALQDILYPDRLARAYLDRHGTAPLAALLEPASTLADLATISCDSARRSAIAGQIRQDFATGDVVVADRIVAARTECVIAAACLSLAMTAGTPVAGQPA